jgi:hypothetical protein
MLLFPAGVLSLPEQISEVRVELTASIFSVETEDY